MIERSEDGILFKVVAELPALGNGNSIKKYEWLDKNIPSVSKIYYRLRLIDIDSSYQYSRIFSVDIDNKEFLNITPGIIHNSLSISINEKNNSFAVIKIFTTNGRLVYSKNASLQNGTEIIISDVDRLPSGMYFIQVVFENHRFTKKFLKE